MLNYIDLATLCEARAGKLSLLAKAIVAFIQSMDPKLADVRRLPRTDTVMLQYCNIREQLDLRHNNFGELLTPVVRAAGGR